MCARVCVCWQALRGWCRGRGSHPPVGAVLFLEPFCEFFGEPVVSTVEPQETPEKLIHGERCTTIYRKRGVEE